MTRKASSQRSLIFEVAVFAALACLLLRGAFPVEGSPKFSPASSSELQIMLGAGFPEPGMHHFFDGTTIGGVMELTGVLAASPVLRNDPLADQLLHDGDVLEIIEKSLGCNGVVLSWLPAGQRLALGIPLHPDRMNRDDWVILPGIGESLAARIESDRQSFGDFGSFEALERVKGIGPHKLATLRQFFVDESN